MFISKVPKCLPYILDSGVSTVLIGPHGIGKSQVIKQYTVDQGIGFIDLRLGTMSDAGDLIGLADFKHDSKGNKVSTHFMKPSYLPTKGEGILFLDELNRAPNDLIQPIFQLILDRKMDVNGYELPKGWKILAAMNPPTDDYTVTNFKDLAFNDRFMFLKVEADFKGFMNYAKGKKFDSRILSFLHEHPNHLNEELADFDVSEFAKKSSRSWEFVNNILKLNPPSDILSDLILGTVGLEAGTSFLSSLEKEDKPIKAEDVFNDIKNVLKRSDLDRSDKISFTIDELIDHIKTKDFNKENRDSLVRFLGAINKDDAIKFLLDIASVGDAISNPDSFEQATAIFKVDEIREIAKHANTSEKKD